MGPSVENSHIILNPGPSHRGPTISEDGTTGSQSPQIDGCVVLFFFCLFYLFRVVEFLRLVVFHIDWYFAYIYISLSIRFFTI